MKHIFHTIQHTARAATVLLLALLTAQTAWAEEAVTYIDMDGKTKTVTEYTEVTTDMTANGSGNINWSSGTYVVKSSVTLNGCIRYSGEVIDLIVCDGATLTVNGNSNGAFDGNTLNIYAQSNGTGMGVVNAKKNTSCNQLNIAGGKVTLDADGKSYGLYVFSGDACGLTVNGGDVTIQNSHGSQSAIYFNGQGFVTLNGGKLTVTNSMGNGYMAIRGNSGSNTLNFNGGTAVINGKIVSCQNINLNGGNVTVNGEIYKKLGYTVTYDFTRATDSYYINAFSNDLYSSATRTVQVKDGATFLCNGKSYSGTLSDNQISAISGKTMTPDVSDHFSVNDAGTEYTIHTATGWGYFCDMLEGGETFSGKTVKLDADITVSRMAGGQPFTGTFDGDSHTLTLAYGTADAPVDAQFVAPFVETARDTSPVFRNLTIDGTIYATHTAATDHDHVGGLIGHLFGDVTIEHCVSRVEIHAKGGAGGFVGLCEHSVSFTDCHSAAVVHSAGGNNSGFVAWSRASGWNINFTGCLFDGKLLQQNGKGDSNGGFIGWTGSNKTVTITNSLCAPAPLADGEKMASSNSATFARGWNATTKATNCYYTQSLGAAQGKQARAVTAGTDVTIEAIALTGTATQYTVSGITAYSGGGLQRGETLYYGIDDKVSLTLSNTATGAPDGYQYGYTTNAGTLEGSTLTMPDADVTVSVNTEVLTVLPWSGDGSKSSPYIIYNKDQLDLLAHRVNGTHSETLREDGYSGKYFQLDKDISYPHTTDWDDAECEQENNFEAIGGYYGSTARYFRGHFDGNNKTISGIRIYKGGSSNADRYQGIFGQTYGADIHHLTLADARITGYHYTGGIVGENNDGTVTGCHVAADVAVCAVQSGTWNHGGIAGYTDGTIEECTSAATLTTADANNSRFYGGIAGNNNGGTLSDNLAIGATVPTAANNTYGAITGSNGGTLQRNYYAACKVANEENATDVGCGHIDNDGNGYITADVNNVNNPDGARAVFALTLADGITTSTAAIVTHAGTGYYAQGTAIALSYSGTPGDAPDGYQYGFTASAGTLNGNTLTMPAADVTVSFGLRSTHEAVEVSYVDAGGTAQTAQAIALDGHETVDSYGDINLTAGTYYVGTDIAYANRIWLDGDITLILANGKTMTLNGNRTCIDGGRNLTIYGQSLDVATAGTLRYNGTSDGITAYNYEQHSGNVSITTTGFAVKGILASVTLRGGTLTVSANGNNARAIMGGTHSILGGQLTATGTGAYTTGILAEAYDGTALTLGCTTASDFIYVSSYDVGYQCTLKIADGQTLFDEDGNIYSDKIYDHNILNGKTLRLSPGIALTARQAPDGNYWTTYYNSAQGFTIDKNENACAYTATYGDGQLTLHKLGELGKEIPAETAVIIVADNSVVSMAATDGLPAYSGPTNNLSGVDDDTPTSDLGTGTFYVLGMTTVGDEQHFGFHRYTGEEMAAHKAYVLVSGSQAPARSLTMVFDEATGIESLTPDAAPKPQAAQHWFTLDGRRLQAKPTAPGIYINNGRKVMIK